MDWLQTLDTAIFRWINVKLANPAFDVLMPFLSGNALFYPALILLAVWLLWKGGTRGATFTIMVVIVLAAGDAFICRNIKQALDRPRPFQALKDVRLPTRTDKAIEAARTTETLVDNKPGASSPRVFPERAANRSVYTSMPSSHAANWFSALMVALIYYRRSIRFMLPIAAAVSFSRVYNGVHYPSDAIAGAILGAGYGAAIVWSLDALWTWAGGRWFPLWWRKFPSLLNPLEKPNLAEAESEEPVYAPRRGAGQPAAALEARHVTVDQHWLRLGYLCVFLLLIARLFYIAGDTIQLSEDESYQWLWSKHLDLSYFSKPPMIAYAQFLGTSLWGDTELGVRFLSPVIAAVLGLVMLRFFAREVNARAGFFLLLIVTTTPLLAAGSVLMTVDPLSVLFWTLAMVSGWKAVQPGGTTTQWLWTGLWMGLGFLSKYTELFQWLSWVVFFALWKPARAHLKRPGPWLALTVNLLCSLPVIIWNSQHHWITAAHVADNAQLGKKWSPTLRHFAEFIGAEAGLLNPIYFVAVIWACVAFWRRGRHNPRLVFFFSMGAPLFLCYLLFTAYARVLPNWIAPSVLPLLCVMVIYWDSRLRMGFSLVRNWLATGLILGGTLVICAHNTDVIRKIAGRHLPVELDILTRVRGWNSLAKLAGEARQELMTEGKPVFIIGSHYGVAGEISFYLPEAKSAVRSGNTFVYVLSSDRPMNQFYFWPGYQQGRQGQNALYVRLLSRKNPDPKPPPPRLEAEFDSVTDLGVTNIMYRRDTVLQPVQIFACRGLK